MSKFYTKDCPNNLTLFQWLSEKTNMIAAIADVPAPFNHNSIIEIPHQLNIAELIENTLLTLSDFGIKGWQTTKGSSNLYGGLSMVYNPDSVESIDMNQATLGTTLNKPDQFYYGSTENFKSTRNTYFDSYGFRKLSPCIDNGKLKKFINEFHLSITRSRIAVLDGFYHDKLGEEFLWHKDETIFENLRINIPIETDEAFRFQLENNEPIHLEIGKIYTWDTHLPHRIYSTKKLNKKRVHLVLGFTPWFRFIENEDAFETNEYFGKLHPFEILLSNRAHDLVGI